MMRRNLPGLAPALLALAVLATAGAGVAAAASDPVIVVDDHQTLITFPAPVVDLTSPARPTVARVIALPTDATRASVEIKAGRAESAGIAGGIMVQRGQKVACVTVTGQQGEVTVAVRHDGSWAAGDVPRRLASAGLHDGVPGRLPGQKAGALAPGGSYVIVTAPAFQAQADALADWKRRKGWPTVVVTTDETGGSPQQIQAWLQDAYDTWDRPPEYVLLLGDVAEIPSFVITVSSGTNPTDLPFVLLEGDDWLADAMIGRLSVSTPTEAQVAVTKTIAYDRDPYLADDGWFTRSIMVAGNEASSTPTHTVVWCGEHLETIGFDPATEFLQPPLPPNAPIASLLNPAIEAGCSIVAYRGWAQSYNGWATPRYLWTDFGSLANDNMLPVVMSFVCETGNYGAESDCFGEKFVTHGEPGDPPRGAVAFIGNTEGHSHTRHNDAMATCFFEQLVKPEITSLGELMNTAKLRFIEFFPTELDVATYDELAVEFYFNIYNLLGDPELRFHKSVPTALTVTTAPAGLDPGANYVEVQVHEADGTTPLAGARVGVVQDGALLGSGLTDTGGLARIALDPVAAGPDVAITVTHPARQPVELAVTAGQDSQAWLVVTGVAVEDGEAPAEGNGDGLASPGETLALLPTLHNPGQAATETAQLELALTGPATGSVTTATLTGLPADTEGTPEAPFVVAVDPGAVDGTVILGTVRATRGQSTDLSQFQVTVAAPAVEVTDVAVAGEGRLQPGETSEITLTLHNAGSVATAGGTVSLAVESGDGIEVTDGTAAFGALAPGASGAAQDAIALAVAPTTAIGAGVSLRVTVTCDEGAVRDTETIALVVGDVDVAAPVGPDPYGYYAYDSADVFYPAQKPSYAWTELSTAYGSALGTRLPFVSDNYDVFTMDLPFPFTFYGQEFGSVRISDNGWISFDSADASYNFYNWPIPNEHGNASLVAPFWDNLNPVFEPAENDTTGLASDGVYWYHDVAAGTFTVEWSRMRHYKSGIPGVQTFQVVLLDQTPEQTGRTDDDILFLYKQVANNDHLRMYATVGVEAPSEDRGLQLTYDNLYTAGMVPLGDGLAVRVTTEPPVYTPYRVDAFTVAGTGGGLDFAWRVGDERTVTGWDVVAVTGDERRQLNPEPLPAAARSFRAAAATADRYVLISRHPYGVKAEAGTTTGAPSPTAARLALGPIAPNPVRGETSIAFTLPRGADVRLRIYDVRGRCVRTLVEGSAAAGETVVVWQGRDDRGRSLANGVYFSRLEVADQILTRKLLLAR